MVHGNLNCSLRVSYPNGVATWNSKLPKLVQLSSGEIVTAYRTSDSQTGDQIRITNPYNYQVRILNSYLSTENVTAFAFTPNMGGILASATRTTIYVWNMTNGDVISSWPASFGEGLTQLVFLSNGDLVSAESGWYGFPRIKIWNAEKNFRIKNAIVLTNRAASRGLALLNNGYLVFGDESYIYQVLIDILIL